MTQQRWLGWMALVVCGVILFVWIPLDVDTGITEKVRRQVKLGDAFAPSVAAALIGLGGLMLLLERRHTSNTESISIADVKHAAVILCLVAISLFLMRYSGPVALAVFEGNEAEYRLLRDTAPWKYIGFIAGGMWLIVSLIALVEQRLRWQHFIIALIAVTVLIAFYDLPFEDLLLPPNGDV